MAKLKAQSALKFLLKLALSALAIYLVFSKIELAEVWAYMRQINPFYLILAIVLFNLSKWIAAKRLLNLFHTLGSKITWSNNLKLYYLGMFYNLFLPGGIGGDGFKIYYLGKSESLRKRDLLGAVLLDRISGAALLAFLAFALASFQEEIVKLIPGEGKYIMFSGAVLAIPALIVLIYVVFPRFRERITSLVLLSLLVQVSQVLCVWFILLGFGVHENYGLYFVLFLVSSIAAMLPISVGGVGLRELVFLYASQELPIDETSSVSLAAIFFVITASSSFLGIFIKMPKPEHLNKATE